jgi:hypothetical protein
VPAGFADGTDADSGGTVTSIDSGAGLAGGPITDVGSLSLAPCPNTEVLKSTGGGYACGQDVDTDTTYSAAANGGLTLSGGDEFAIADDGVNADRLANSSVGPARSPIRPCSRRTSGEASASGSTSSPCRPISARTSIRRFPASRSATWC